jgi:serine/threonine protein kinase
LALGATTDHATAFAPLAVKVNPLTNSRMSSTLMAGPPILSEWQILKNGSVVGTIKNHPVIDDGDVITTSPVTNPDDAKANAIVVTSSGSKYKLGKQAKGKAPPAANVLSAAAASPNNAEAARLAKTKYDLNGQMVGDTYLLAGKPLRSTSGKSTIWTAYLMDAEGMPKGSPLTIKVSSNIESIKREAENYKRVTSGLTKGQFVKCYDYYTIPAGPKKPLVEQCALVMDKGDDDLKAYLVKNGPLTGKQLREAAIAAIQCLQAVHSANLVWTDLKTENFVVLTSKGLSFRGIDLESAMPVLDNPVDYSPEACPPEFADALLEGMGPYFILEYSYDIWSLGMMLFELSTGRPVFDGINPDKVTKMLKNPDYQVDVRAVPDDKLRELVKACLQTDPQRRPSLTQVFLHPYFLTTGFGPFSF